MPQSLVKKVANNCNMDIEEVEDIGEEAKKKAKEQDHEEDGGYITSIFKSMVPKDCKNKMNGNKKEESQLSVIEKINRYLNENSGTVTTDRKKEAEKGVKKNKKTIEKIDSVDEKGITHSGDEFVSGEQAAESGKGGVPKHLKNIIKAGTQLYIAKNGKMPPYTK